MFKLFAVVIVAAGFWLGIKADRFLLADRCLDAGGNVAQNGICLGARTQ